MTVGLMGWNGVSRMLGRFCRGVTSAARGARGSGRASPLQWRLVRLTRGLGGGAVEEPAGGGDWGARSATAGPAWVKLTTVAGRPWRARVTVPAKRRVS